MLDIDRPSNEVDVLAARYNDPLKLCDVTTTSVSPSGVNTTVFVTCQQRKSILPPVRVYRQSAQQLLLNHSLPSIPSFGTFIACCCLRDRHPTACCCRLAGRHQVICGHPGRRMTADYYNRVVRPLAACGHSISRDLATSGSLADRSAQRHRQLTRRTATHCLRIRSALLMCHCLYLP